MLLRLSRILLWWLRGPYLAFSTSYSHPNLNLIIDVSNWDRVPFLSRPSELKDVVLLAPFRCGHHC